MLPHMRRGREDSFLQPNRRPRIKYYSFRSDNALSLTNAGSTFAASFGNDQSWAGAKNVKIAAVRATIWFATPNLTLPAQMLLSFTYPGTETPPVQLAVDIPRGLHGFDGLNDRIRRRLVEFNVREDAFALDADWATQKINFVFKLPGTLSLGGSGARELAIILGLKKPFSTANNPTDPQATQSVSDSVDFLARSLADPVPGIIPGWTVDGTSESRVIAPFHARFEPLQFFNISTNLADGGLVGNAGVQLGVVAQVMIDRLPGEQIVYDPANPIEVDASAFEGVQLPLAVFILMDDKFNSVDTNGQAWTVTIRVREDL